MTDTGAAGTPAFLSRWKRGSLDVTTIQASPDSYLVTLYQIESNRNIELANVTIKGSP
jgi:hypothetical protein